MTFHSKNGGVSPDDKPQLMKLQEVCKMLQISRASIYRWVEEGIFPQPVILGTGGNGKRSAVRWYESDILAWLKAKPKGTQKDGS